MLVCGPQHLDEPVACTVHRFPLEAVVASAGKDDDDLRTVVFPESRGQRIDDASGCQILVLQIDGVACRRDGREVERLHLPNLAAVRPVPARCARFRRRRRAESVPVWRARWRAWPRPAPAIGPSRSATERGLARRVRAPPHRQPLPRPRVAAHSCAPPSDGGDCHAWCAGVSHRSTVRSMPPQNATASSMTTIFW